MEVTIQGYVHGGFLAYIVFHLIQLELFPVPDAPAWCEERRKGGGTTRGNDEGNDTENTEVGTHASFLV